MKSFLIVSIVTAVIVSFLFQGDVPITGTKVKLGTPGYDIQDVSTPVATGTLLEYLAYLFTQSRFGPSIRRYLLNDNHVEIARDLAAQIHLSPLYYPMRRVGKDELYAISEEESIAQLTAALQTGVSGSRGKLSDTPRTIEEYAAFYKEGHLPSQVIQRTLQTMRAWEKEGFNIFSNVNDEDVMRQAYASDARHKAGQALSVLDGVPIAFKDMMSIENLTYYNGNSNKAKHSMNWKTSSVDDIMVRRFRAQGAIIYGYTIMVEGGVTPLGWNSHFQGPTSPYSLNRYSGGSSSGSAVAVATGLVPVAVGFDGGGSIRVPSGMSGIHGLATTFGRIPFENHTDSVLIKAGPMSASAADAAITYAVMAPNDLDGFYSQLYDGGVHGPPLPHLSGFDSIDDLSDVRLGIYPEWFNDSDEKVRTRCYEVVDFLKSKGAQIVEIQIPHLQAVLISQGLKIASEFAAGWDSKFHNTPDSLEPNTRITVGIGSSASALEVLSGEKIRHYMVDYIAKLFKKEKLTAIINPTVGVEIPILTEEAKKRGESNTALTLRVMRHASFVNFLGLPGYTVPVGFIEPTQLDPHEPASTKVPVPFQFIGDHWSDHKLLRLGRAVEAGFTAKLEKPPRPLYYHDPLQV